MTRAARRRRDQVWLLGGVLSVLGGLNEVLALLLALPLSGVGAWLVADALWPRSGEDAER